MQSRMKKSEKSTLVIIGFSSKHATSKHLYDFGPGEMSWQGAAPFDSGSV